jgi:hypothetical protein
MTKRTKLIMYLLIIGSLVSVSAVILTARQRGKSAGSPPAPGISREQMTANYKSAARAIMADYDGMEKSGGFTATAAGKLKERLLGLVVPAEYKDLHIAMVLGLSEIEDSFQPDQGPLMDQGRNKITAARSDRPWLE